MTDRIPLAELTSDQLDGLYTRAELADTVTAETKRLMARRTTTLRTRAERAEAAIERVRKLHRKASHGDTCVYCAHGKRLGYDTTWPCDTIRALDEQPGPAATQATDSPTCQEHDGPCFPDPDARCSAHGDRACAHCHRNPSTCADPDVLECGRWLATGMHWDTCSNRIRGPLGEQPGPTVTAAAEPRADLVLHRDRGIGVTVVEAPQRSSMALDILTRGDGYIRVRAGVIEIADQVAYRITGYDPDEQVLLLDLVADWRTDVTARAGQLAAVLGEVLGEFKHETHPGRRCLQSGHVDVGTVERWRAVLHLPKEQPHA